MKMKNKITIIYLLVYKKKKHLFQSVDYHRINFENYHRIYLEEAC